MKKGEKKEIYVIIISSVVVIITTIVMGIINMQKETKQVFIKTPDIESVDFVEYFGLKKNKIFNYKKRVSEDDGSYTSHEHKIRIEVTDEIKTNNGTLFILDNDILNPSIDKSKTGILLVTNLVFFLDNSEVETLSKLISGDKIDFDKNTATYQERFILPFFNGQRFGGDIYDYMRTDNRYSYYVQKEGSSNYFDGQKMIEQQRYRLYFSTLPDTSYIEFIPYVGIVSINFHHNGTKYEEVVELSNVEN